jgi:hypothetical protein
MACTTHGKQKKLFLEICNARLDEIENNFFFCWFHQIIIAAYIEGFFDLFG